MWPPGQERVNILHYSIRQIPVLHSILDIGPSEILVEFSDRTFLARSQSNPEEEGRLFLDIFSLFLRTQVKLVATTINEVQVTPAPFRTNQYNSKIDSIDQTGFENILSRLFQLKPSVFRRMLRSCRIYNTSLGFILTDPTLAIYLLVASLESIAHIVESGGTKEDRFVRFIEKNSGLDWNADVKETLLNVYKFRGEIAHNGTEFNTEIDLVGSINIPMMKIEIDGQEKPIPNAKWFEKLVQQTLLNFLKNQPAASLQNDLGKEAAKRAIVTIPLKAMKEPNLITFADEIEMADRNQDSQKKNTM